MARKSHPDHAGRMPDHPRYGNPSDEAEEAGRIGKAYENVDKWQRKYGAEFSGGVSMSYGDGPVYNVPIGDREIGQKIVGRPISQQPKPMALPEPAESAPEPEIAVELPPRQSWLARLFTRIKGVFQ
jgi:hypothetical protein